MINRVNMVAEAIETLIVRIGRATSWVALVIIILMTCNVLLRYTFNYGTVWAQELEWHLMGALILFGMSYALQEDGHVRVDLFYAHYKKRAKFFVDVFSMLLQIGICVFIIWLSMRYVEQSYSIGEISSDPGGLAFRWAIKALLPVGFTLLLLQSLGAMAALFVRYQEKNEASNA